MRRNSINFQQIVGNNIKIARYEKGLSQKELAEQSDVQQNYISEIEAGKRNITLSILHQIADALDIEPCSLIETKCLNQQEDIQTKPLCPVNNVSSSIYYLLALAKRSLYEAGEGQRINEMIERVYASQSYDEVYQIITEYVEPCNMNEYAEQRYHISQM